jgi:DNA replicative helicase MCM subunit Mcm2 (Cdc46/Mcm family)
LRKYIAYARQYVHPILTSEAATVIKSFYLGLRQQSAADPGAPPVTHRQLESLVRLAEARARVDLRERVTADDAEDAVEIMKESLAGMICSGPEMINFTSGTGNNNHGGKRGFQAERRRFLDALHRHCEAKNDKDVEVHELYTIADRIELAVTDTSGFIDQLNEVGDLLKRGGGRYSYNAGTLRLRKNTQEQQQQHQQFGTPFEERHNYNSTAGAGGAAAAGRSYQQQEHQRGAVAGKRGAQEPVYDDHDGGFDW